MSNKDWNNIFRMLNMMYVKVNNSKNYTNSTAYVSQGLFVGESDNDGLKDMEW